MTGPRTTLPAQPVPPPAARESASSLLDGLPYSIESVRDEVETACYENIEQAQPLTDERLDWLINTVEQLAAEVLRLRMMLLERGVS